MLRSSRYLHCGSVTIRHPKNGSARCHGNTGTRAPSCCRLGDYFYNYDPCDGLSTLEVFCLKNHDRTLHRPTAGSSTPDFDNQVFSFHFFSIGKI